MNLYKDYPEYLKSLHWKNLNSSIRARANYKCEICSGQDKPVPCDEVHHINYRNWIDVLDSDLIAVCESCHCKIHEAIKSGYINQDNKGSKENTIEGLVNFQKNGPKLSREKRTTYYFNQKLIDKMNDANYMAKLKIKGILKVSTTDFSYLLGKSVRKSIYFRILRASSFEVPYRKSFIDIMKRHKDTLYWPKEEGKKRKI